MTSGIVGYGRQAYMDPSMGLSQIGAMGALNPMQRAQAEQLATGMMQVMFGLGIGMEATDPGGALAGALATGQVGMGQISDGDLMMLLASLNRAGQAAAQNYAQTGQFALPKGQNYGGIRGTPGSATIPGPGSMSNLPATERGRRLAQSASQVANNMGTVGRCKAGVRQAMERAGLGSIAGQSAYQAAGQLARRSDFREVNVSGSDLRNLPPGAVVVWGQTDRSPHGHISVSLGNGYEASDHVSRQLTSLRGDSRPRVFIPA